MPIPVIDLFAGPGGLGEGFSALNRSGQSLFRIGLSVEKDEFAHRTLRVRAFFRQFPTGKAPDAYYAYLAGRIGQEQLFNAFPKEAENATHEAWLAELGGSRFPATLVDDRIRSALRKRPVWVLIGGPPCQAYSLVGRAKIIGEKGRKAWEADERQLLYREYLRILAAHQPPVFVMENVKGLLSAKVQEQGVFERILSDLEKPVEAIYGLPGSGRSVRYRLVSLIKKLDDGLARCEPKDFVVRTEDHGLPQARHRIIILGIRSDITAEPRLLPRSAPVTVDEVIHGLPRLRSGLSKEPDSPMLWEQAVQATLHGAWFDRADLPQELRLELLRYIDRISVSLNRGAEWIPGNSTPRRLMEWFRDPKLGGVCNHETRSHIREDLHRYFFAAVYARHYGRSPLLGDFPEALLPRHNNVAEALKKTKFNDRFRVQLADRPSTTVVSHISKDGHYFIHPDPTQCRSLTVREAARLQTFPDNYFFEGPRTEQYHQVGNAVPPLLARQIADIVAEMLA